ncbi:MAG: nickel-dependent hydrogenase large subunit [Myxococcales bacterium]|nr:nickel-dependent hydrogenase large subunit [Myxococcales bacterium]
MMSRRTIDIAMNRVEGDLEVRVDVEDGVVVDAWSAGTLYRGFETLLVGRGALDGLVLTPRICGLCSVSHLFAAARALDGLAGVGVAPHGARLRNVTLMAEHLQNDLRQSLLMFAVDFTSPAYAAQPLYEEAVRRYQPFAGSAVREVLRTTKRMLEIVALLGGQWPHSSFMVPGGVVTVPSSGDLQRCRHLLAAFRAYYEQQILGCSLERWQRVTSAAELDAWLDASPAHQASELGFFLRFGRAAGLDRIGGGYGRMLCAGGLAIPEGSRVTGPRGAAFLAPPGVATGTEVAPFDEAEVKEHVASSWYLADAEPGGRHPFEGRTQPYASGAEGRKYSWSKAPRYAGKPAETGVLAELVVGGDPLFTDLVRRGGAHALVRQMARLVRPATLLEPMDRWLSEMATEPGPYCSPDVRVAPGRSAGILQASRGMLGHWLEVEDDRLLHYQIITPTAWNGSPRDDFGARGPWEEALVGTPVPDLDNPVALGHVVRSFDPCLVCTVHAFGKSGQRGTLRLGG